MRKTTEEEWDAMSLIEQAVLINQMVTEGEKEFDRKWAEKFGDCENPPEDEMGVDDDQSLSHEQKVQKLKTMRAAKRRRTRRTVAKPTKADSVRLRGMGIHLV